MGLELCASQESHVHTDVPLVCAALADVDSPLEVVAVLSGDGGGGDVSSPERRSGVFGRFGQHRVDGEFPCHFDIDIDVDVG